jgi:hypothetical protein
VAAGDVDPTSDLGKHLVGPDDPAHLGRVDVLVLSILLEVQRREGQ